MDVKFSIVPLLINLGTPIHSSLDSTFNTIHSRDMGIGELP